MIIGGKQKYSERNAIILRTIQLKVRKEVENYKSTKKYAYVSQKRKRGIKIADEKKKKEKKKEQSSGNALARKERVSSECKPPKDRHTNVRDLYNGSERVREREDVYV